MIVNLSPQVLVGRQERICIRIDSHSFTWQRYDKKTLCTHTFIHALNSSVGIQLGRGVSKV